MKEIKEDILMGFEGFEKEDYDKIDELVKNYQDDIDRDTVGIKLLDIFHPYLVKYFGILKHGRVNLNDLDTRKFLSLFIPDKNTRRLLCYKWHSSEVKIAAYKAANILCESFYMTPNEDLMQDLRCAFLVLVDRYSHKKSQSSFAGYIFNAFRYEIYRTIKTHTTDPLTYSSNLIVSYDDEEYLNEKSQFEFEQEISKIDSKYTSIPHEKLDTNWIYGLTCDNGFEKLAPLDRLIIKMKYIEQCSDIEIAKATGYHINTINSRRRAAEKILERLHCEEED